MKVKMKAEYNPSTIRHLAIECPECKKWFKAVDLTDVDINDECDAERTLYRCPICGLGFVPILLDGMIIEECNDYNEVYKECLTKSVKWNKEND